MTVYVIDLDDPRERWEELYRALEQEGRPPASEPARGEAPPCEPGLDPVELLRTAFWAGG